MNKTCKVSIICPAYNHEKYVKYFIESVLNQTVQDFELIIIDDCSTDNTVDEIKKFNDDRIKLIQHDWNKGFVVAWNDLIENATGDIICTTASDDILEKNYLEEVLKAFKKDESLDVFYTSVRMIDENNDFIKNQRIELNSKTSKYQILKNSFISSNQLPSPGMAYKKASIERILPFSCGLLQYIDWQTHIKMLLLDSNVKCSDKFLLRYRISPQSASSFNYNVYKREICETYAVMDPFLEIKDLSFFKKIFSGLYEEFGEPTVKTIPYFIARMAMKSKIIDKQKWGYEALLKFVASRDNYETLHDLYNFSFKDLINTVSNCFFMDDKFERKYRKYRKLFNIFLIMFIAIFLIFIIHIILFCL